jgi:ubiquinone/menaquinone biosynthesis C-methylase UbiE/uncharacterized protein YbaR (Trm112 family)
MKTSFLKRLRCPITNTTLTLQSFEEEVIDNDIIIKEGVLISEKAKVWYPISNYVPVMLIFKTDFHERFKDKYAQQLSTYSDLNIPQGKCEKGEKFVQKTFTEEWSLTQESELSFLRTDSDLVNLNKYVWLKWITPQTPVTSILNIGCGIGKETMALKEITNTSEIIAVDLNFAVMQAGSRYKNIENIEFVICSLFHLPFEQETFDLVYSQGVIHHTFSTEAAFNSIAAFVKKAGYLFIWVYALDDHLLFINSRGLRNRIKHYTQLFLWRLEALIRPWLSQSPTAIRGIIIFLLGLGFHPLIKSRVNHSKQWKFQNTQHSLRDLFTPRFAFRHNMNEVIKWYENLSFTIHDIQSPAAHIKYFNGKKINGIGLTGKKLA